MTRTFKSLIYLLLTACSLQSWAAENVFLDRQYWKSSPDIETVKADIKKGNDPAASNYYGFDGVTYAILEDAPFETIAFMIKQNGNSPDKITHDGRNYIFWAAFKNNLPVVQHLVENGSRTDIIDTHGHNALTFTANAGVTNTDLYDYLLENGFEATTTNRNGANAFLLLMPNLKDFETAEYFLKKGVDVNSVDKDGNGAFHYAASGGNINMMDKLITLGMNPQQLNNEGGNAMLMASRVGRGGANSIEVFKYLENKGIEANISTSAGTNPLHLLAGRAEDMEVLQFFLSRGVDPNQANAEGNTPFMLAAESNNLEVVKILESEKTEIYQANNDGYTALDLALKSNSAEVVSYLIRKGAAPAKHSAKMLIAGYKRDKSTDFEKKLGLLKSKGFDTKATFENNNTLAHYAAEHGDITLYQILLKEEVNVNIKNKESYTPLHLVAMKAKDIQLLKFLVKNGADRNVLTDFEESAYLLASENEILQKNENDISFLRP